MMEMNIRNPFIVGGSEYYKTVYGPYLRCEAAGFIGPADAQPDFVATTLHGGMTWTSALNDMFSNVESRCGAAGAAFGGMVHFEKLVGQQLGIGGQQSMDVLLK